MTEHAPRAGRVQCLDLQGDFGGMAVQPHAQLAQNVAVFHVPAALNPLRAIAHEVVVAAKATTRREVRPHRMRTPHPRLERREHVDHTSVPCSARLLQLPLIPAAGSRARHAAPPQRARVHLDPLEE